MQTKTKILVFLALWRRPEITEICFLGLERLKQHPDFRIDVLAVLSEPEMVPLCEKYGVHWIAADNLPLGRKKNTGLQAAKNFDFDYLMEIGSDDLILNCLLDSYKPFIDQKKDFFGIVDMAYIDSQTGTCRRLTSTMSTYGAGRMISKSALEKVDYHPWRDEIIRGMDNNSLFAFARKGVIYGTVKPMDVPGVIDIKSEENIWKFNYHVGREYDIEQIFSRLSDEETTRIKAMYEFAEQD